MIKTKSVVVMAALVVVSLLLGCEKPAEQRHRLDKAEKARLDSIDRAAFKVGVMPTLDCLPVYVAKDEGIFDTLGVDVHLKGFSAQMDCDTALERGRVEGAITDLLRAKRLEKKGTSLRYAISTDTYWQLITNRKSRISNIKQLSDKMIAITRFSATDYLASLAIDSAKPKFDVYRVQINDVRIRLKMLINNEMDAVLLTEPQATRARMDKNPVLMDSREKGLRLGAFVFRDKALESKSRQQQFSLFVKAYDRAVDSININGIRRYADLLKKYCGVEDKTVKALPKITFSHAAEPSRKDLAVSFRE